MLRMRDFCLLSLLLAGGCAAVQTFGQQTQDLTSGASAQRVQDAQAREQAASAEGASLTLQLEAVDARRDSVQQEVDAADTRLQQVKRQLNASHTATERQRASYHLLLQKQRSLKTQIAATGGQHPVNAEDAEAEQAQLTTLSRQKDELQHEIDGLQHAL